MNVAPVFLLFSASIAIFGCPASAGSHPRDSQDSAWFDYLYLDANEDQASGGHSAVRLGDDVFHFQYDDGLLRMEREDWAGFQLAYRGYQNRNIHVSRIAVSRDTYRRVRAAFVRRHLTQGAQLDRLTDARADAALVEDLSATPARAIEVPGLGFFVEGPVRPKSAASNRLRGLREQIDTAFGVEWLAKRRRQLSRTLQDLEVVPLQSKASDFEPGALPHPRYPFHQQYTDTVAALRALDVLEGRLALRPALRRTGETGTEELALQSAERVALARSIPVLQFRLVQVARGTRPDWGPTLLLGMGRLVAMDASLRENRWVFPAVQRGDVRIHEVRPRWRSLLPLLAADASREWRDALQRFQDVEDWDEIAYARLATAALHMEALEQVELGAEEVSLRVGRAAPRGAAWLEQPPHLHAIDRDAKRLRAATREAARTTEAYARDRLGYHILTRNCVTELFATLEGALAQALRDRGEEPSPGGIQAEAGRRLGGPLPDSAIPFRSSDQVRRRWNVVARHELPSLRRQQIAELVARADSPWTRMRESNTLTTSVYARSDDDSLFLFFTDGSPAIRPLLGIANLTTALGGSALGVLRIPFDGGRSLQNALRGVAFSLPELAFQNIRKGTRDWIPRELRALP